MKIFVNILVILFFIFLFTLFTLIFCSFLFELLYYFTLPLFLSHYLSLAQKVRTKRFYIVYLQAKQNISLYVQDLFVFEGKRLILILILILIFAYM